MTPISKKIASRIWGYAKRKEIKDSYPKKVCHMPRHVKKKEKRREENKRSIPKEGMPHASACQKKRGEER